MVRRRRIAAGAVLATLLPRAMAARASLRVACLDWALTETLLALGRPPIAIVAAADWRRFAAMPPLPDTVADLGLQPEINFELLAMLRPDLILTSPFVAHLEPTLERIARTLRISIFEKGDVPLAQPRAIARILGERLDCVNEARRFLVDAERRFDEYRERLGRLHVPPLLLVNFMDGRHVRVYGGAGLYQNVLDRIGLSNAWNGDTNYWGYATVGIERLAIAKKLRLIAFEPIPPDAVPTLQRSPLWSRLPFVKGGQVSVLPPVLMFGAMPSALRFADLLVGHLEGLVR